VPKGGKASAVNGAGYTGAGDTPQQALAIVAVKVAIGSHVVETYAFLVTGSTSFMTEDLMRSLGVTGKKGQMDLRTLSNHQVVSGYEVSGFRISSLDGGATVALPPIFTQPELPVSKNDLLASEILDK
jgi:hypothetical protein